MEKYVCIHGHFYQPPRENAWSNVIELQPSAKPFHDWNARITAECYLPNGQAKILDQQGQLIQEINNYAFISFNFGPTLLSWMEKQEPFAYKNILAGDKLSADKNNGHGNAIAQVYNHMIMPLANAQDKETQIRWGIEDFKKRFQRIPEGMWLAETAVDTQTLENLAKNNIRFTILAPRQAKAIRKINAKEWTIIKNETDLDTSGPYLCKLPSGNSIVLFFYNGAIASAVAFQGLLNSGKTFAEKFLQEAEKKDAIQIINIATDGESYGHHHRFGEMALAYCLSDLTKKNALQVTNYAAFLAEHDVDHEVIIHENSSWSCVHGIERWRSDCGCTDGAHPVYHQQWRAPLRNALNWLRDRLDALYSSVCTMFSVDAIDLRNKYIHCILDKTETAKEKFFEKYCDTELSALQKEKILSLLEIQRFSQLMFTSCAWFFEEVSGIETVQILQYADRAIQGAETDFSVELLQDFLALLSLAPSNVAAYGNAAVLFRKEVYGKRPSQYINANVLLS